MPDKFHDFCDLQNIFRNNIVASNSLNPGPARRSVGPDLGLNCLDKIAASTASHCQIYSITFLVATYAFPMHSQMCNGDSQYEHDK